VRSNITTAVDLFSGAGGFTTGAQAAGVDVLACGNHWAEAIAIHEANHPGVEHICANLLELDMGRLPAHDLLLASPACQGHSQASQPTRRPKHQADRNTAWAVICAAEAHRPTTILVENVVDMKRWVLFDAWIGCMEKLGYDVRTHVFDTAEFGVPQNRKRLIVSARLGGALDLESPQMAPAAFRESIDWDASDGRGWARWKDKTPGVRRRVEGGRAKGLGESFLVHYDSYHTGRSLDRPIGTITTKAQWALVRGDEIRMLTSRELARGMGFASDYILPPTKSAAVKMLGNAIPPTFAQELCRQVVTA